MKSFPKIVLVLLLLLGIALGGYFFFKKDSPKAVINSISSNVTAQEENPLSIAYMRNQSYPGSDITIEQTLADGSNFHQYLASYQSQGLKIYALLTIPMGENPPAGGWPAILFNHGYIPPTQYRTTERYMAYVEALANHSYIIFKPDYRGHGNSQGQANSAYYSPDYTIDDLNALSSLKKYADVNSSKVGIWGHSLGGNLTLRDLVITQDVKAAVIWGGVVGSYNDLMNNWQRRVSYQPPPPELTNRNRNRQDLINKYGIPQTNPAFWNSIDPTSYIKDITTPIQLDVGESDEKVPVAFSTSLKDKLEANNKPVEYYVYPDSNHNISQSFNSAMKNTLDFFDRYLK